jgi:hypothetical protein
MSHIPVATEKLPEGWAVAKVTFEHTNRKKGQVEDRFEIVHLESGKRYLHENVSTIAAKCALLALGIIGYFALYLSFHLLRMTVTTIKDPSINTFLEGVRNVIRAPFYILGMEFGALYGIFNPLEGRAVLASCERLLHERSHREDACLDTEFNDCSSLWDALSRPDYSATFYVAPCMQSYGAVEDPHIQKIEFLDNHPVLIEMVKV